MKRLIPALLALLFAWTAAPARDISGRVLLRDSCIVAVDFVMIYCKEYGTGTLSDEDGRFCLHLPSGEAKLQLEFSRIGYTTVFREISLASGEYNIGDVVMEPQALMLTAAYVTPNGMDPAQFVLSKVWESAKENRKKQLNYRAEIEYDVATHQIPLVSSVLPKGLVGLARFAVALQGYGPLVRYCLKHDDLSASVKLSRQVRDGKALDFAHRLVRQNPPLPENVKKNVMSLFEMIDLFDMLYGESTDWGQKFSKKHKFRLTGTYEYGDKLVDVVTWSNRRMKVSATLHIVEEDWGILKLQIHSQEGEVMRCESRNVGNGVYMPISFVIKPNISMVRAEDIPALIEEVKKMDNFSKATRERAIKVLEDNMGHDFNPYISVGYNVRYSSIGK